MRYLPHPTREQIELAAVLEALSDPTRLAIVIALAGPKARPELRCNEFLSHGSKTNLTYHFAKLRAAGVTHARAEGTSRLISLRREDLDARFPGMLDSILKAARGSKGSRERMPAGARA